MLLPRLLRALQRLQPDLVHVHSRRGADLYGGAAAALAGIPAVITRRVDAAEPALLARLKYRPYRAVIALSRAIEQQLRDAGVAAERSALIPSAVDTQRYRPDSAARDRLRAAFGLPADALVVGVVAQLIERKRHAWLFALLPELVRAWPQLRVLCFGRGPLERRLRAELAERGLADQVLLAGFRSDLSELLPGLDLLAHPADREGLGLGAARSSQRRSAGRGLCRRRGAGRRRRRRDGHPGPARRRCGVAARARDLARCPGRAPAVGSCGSPPRPAAFRRRVARGRTSFFI